MGSLTSHIHDDIQEYLFYCRQLGCNPDGGWVSPNPYKNSHLEVLRAKYENLKRYEKKPKSQGKFGIRNLRV